MQSSTRRLKQSINILALTLVLFLLFVSSFAMCVKPVSDPALSPEPLVGIDTNTIQLIEWKKSSHATEQSTLESWRRGVGAPLVMMPPDSPREIKALDSLVIISWNTHVGGGDLEHFISDLRDGKLTGGEPIHDFVLLLQEVFRAGPAVPDHVPSDVRAGSYIRTTPPSGERMDILETARRHSLALYYVPSIRNGGPSETDIPEDRGNAILSTMPLSSLTALELPYERQRRVTIGASISGETTVGIPWTIRLINVHLENRAKWSRWFESFGSSRLRQVKAIVNAFQDNTPTILGGDFNTWFGQWKEPAVSYLEQFFDRPTDPLQSSTVKLGYLLPERIVDYLFFRLPEGWGGEYQRVDRLYGSDHYPLLGRVRTGDIGD
jgi:endonuclease/exonuclease/phosphatase family metal-dependent hydrolase